MPTATRPADVVEAMVARVQQEGQTTLAQLRSTFEEAGFGPKEGASVLKRLTELGVVIGADDSGTTKPTTRRSSTATTKKAAVSTRPTTRTAATRPAGRTGESTV